MPAITIALINQKGGCGKSSSCFHAAGYFAKLGYNVLLVDADPQGSLSQGFFGSAEVENLAKEDTLAILFDDDAIPPIPENLPVISPVEQRIAIVRSNQTLAPFNTPTPEHSGMKQQTLAAFLEDLEPLDLFDLVLIDCPPNLYQCSWNALIAADFVLIPVPPEDFGTQGLRVVHQAIENAQTLNPRLSLLGHIISRYDARLLLHKEYEAKLRRIYGESVFETVIPEASAFKVSLACRTPVSHYSPRSKAAASMAAFCEEIIQKIQKQAQAEKVA